MRVLLVHNFYRSSVPSGENVVVEDEIRALRSLGVPVQLHARHSDNLITRGYVGTLNGAMATPWNPFEAERVLAAARIFRADVVHFHNTFPSISFASAHALRSLPVGVVATVHNYRMFCANGIPMRRGQDCTECITSRSVVPALRYGCYRDSRIATLPVAASIALHRYARTWESAFDVFITLTNFQRTLLTVAGLPSDKIVVKSNFYPNQILPVRWKERLRQVVFVGRLSEEKGVDLLLEAWEQPGGAALPQLTIIGAGPMEASLRARSAVLPNVHLLGGLPFSEVQEHLARSSLLVVPSRCFEGLPMVIREAVAHGVPVLASHIGSLPELVVEAGIGMTFIANNASDLHARVDELFAMPDRLAAFSSATTAEFERRYTVAGHMQAIETIYRRAIEVSGERRRMFDKVMGGDSRGTKEN